MSANNNIIDSNPYLSILFTIMDPDHEKRTKDQNDDSDPSKRGRKLVVERSCHSKKIEAPTASIILLR
jgi:hypothetical protein